MYENATTIQLQSGTVDEALLILRAYIVPVLREQVGLLSLCLIRDLATSKITIISLWTSPAHALAVEAASAYRKGVARLGSLIDEPVHPVHTSQASKHVYQVFALN
jgi:quinol monooxygenase YgiN